MGKLLVNIPDEMHQFVTRRVRQCQFADEADYLQSLIRQDQYGANAWDGTDEGLLNLIREGDRSGTPVNLTEEYQNNLKTKLNQVIADAQAGL